MTVQQTHYALLNGKENRLKRFLAASILANLVLAGGALWIHQQLVHLQTEPRIDPETVFTVSEHQVELYREKAVLLRGTADIYQKLADGLSWLCYSEQTRQLLKMQLLNMATKSRELAAADTSSEKEITAVLKELRKRVRSPAKSK